MSAPRRTVAEAFGAGTADELARWAIDVLAGPDVPENKATYAQDAKVPWRDILVGRELLDAAGIDWRTLARDARQRRGKERRNRYTQARRTF
jgi:hypothetical protein